MISSVRSNRVRSWLEFTQLIGNYPWRMANLQICQFHHDFFRRKKCIEVTGINLSQSVIKSANLFMWKKYVKSTKNELISRYF
jgi:hypothetical protein